MATVTQPIVLSPVQFPAGTPSVAKIRCFLQKPDLAGVFNTIASQDVAPTVASVTFLNVADGTYRVAQQAMSTTGFLGIAAVGEPFVVDSRVTLAVPMSVPAATVVA